VEGESIALLEALKVMHQRGISHVIFETYSKSVVDAVHHLCGGVSEFSFLVRNIINILSCNQNFMVKFMKKEAPRHLGDALARENKCSDRKFRKDPRRGRRKPSTTTMMTRP
jgi:ribonuclease HI